MAADLVQPDTSLKPAWLLTTIAVAAIVIATTTIIEISYSPMPRLQAITTDEDTRDTLDDYTANLGSQTLLVGSSLMYRVRQGYFDNHNVRNIAIAGDSPETGLRIIAEQEQLPSLIIVEANILERKPNLALVKEYAPSPLSFGHFISRERPIRTLLALEYGWTSRWLDNYEHQSAIELLARPPAPRSPAPIGVVRDWSTIRNKSEMQHTAMAMVNLAGLLRRKGVHVVFVHLPMSPEVQRSPVAILSREIFRKAATSDDQAIELDVPLAELRWSDGQHLDARSAALVAASLERVITTKTPRE